VTRYLLDTNIVSDLMRNPRGRVATRVAEVGEASVCSSVIVAAELRYGVVKKGSVRLERRLSQLMGILEILPFEPPADLTYGQVRAQLEAAGQMIGGNDLLIAAHAMALGLTLVTDNEREFSRVAGLKWKNWLR
jgi:tRNA(fMet)-specific endonuclease VapC